MKVVGVIPARWGSTRLPGKSLVSIGGKPLILRVAENAVRAARLNSLVVATDDQRIADVVESAGFKAVMTRPDHPSGTDRVAEAIEDLGPEDIVINIQGDEPLIDPGLIDRIADEMAQNLVWDMATAATPIELPEDLGNPSAVKVVCAEDGRALYFSRAPIPHVRDNDMPVGGGLHWWHIGIYGYRKKFLDKLVKTPVCELEKAEKLEQLRALYIGGRILVLKTGARPAGVDTPEDVRRVEAILAGDGGRGKTGGIGSPCR